MKKVLNPGSIKIGRAWSRVFVKVAYSGGCLSLVGVVGPLQNGNCRGSCGQILDELIESDLKLVKGWTADMVKQLHSTWNRWHLNDMRSGSPRQRDHLATFSKFDYEATLKKLAKVNLVVDLQFWRSFKGGCYIQEGIPPAAVTMHERFGTSIPAQLDELPEAVEFGWRSHVTAEELAFMEDHAPYRYGSAWLFEEVPTEVIQWLESLPVSKFTPAWI